MKITNKIILIIIAIVLCLCLGVGLCFMLNKAGKKEETKQNDFKINEFNVDGRTTLKTDNGIYLGNNLKELENNFYDVKIQNTEGGINVYLNKLWYETYGKDYIQDEYLAQICRELSSKLNVETSAEQFEYVVYKYIKDNYTKVRAKENIQEILTDEISLKFELEDNVVKLLIRGG